MPTEPRSVSDKRRERWLDEIARGKTRKQIADENKISRQRVAQIVGRIESPGEREEIHVYSVRSLFDKVSEIAASFGLRHKAGRTAGQGSVGLLIEQIGLGNLVVTEPENELNDDQAGDLSENS
jgi:hypothetical protein